MKAKTLLEQEFVFAAYKDKGFTPLLCISDLKYPHNYSHLQATLLPEYKTEWKLEKQNNYNQDYVYNKELVIKNTEWRTCYDEGIRYQYPLSAGHSLRIKKSFLVDYLKKEKLQLGFFVRLTRMNDAKANIHNPPYEKVMLYDFEKELSVKQKNKNTFRLNDFKKSKIFPVFIRDIENREVDLKKINEWINVEHFRVPITQLMLYAQHNCRDKIKTLLEAGANPNLIANDGSTAILLALQSDQFEIAALLLEKTDKTALESQTAIKKITPLEVAIEKLKVDIIDRMLKKGVSVEKRLCLGFETPLYFTIQMIGRLQSNLNIPMDEQDVKELLKSQGQETNTELINELKNYDNYKEILYPFLFSDKDAYSKLLKILDSILDNKPDLEAKNTNNLTALMFAAELGLNEVIEKLLDAKADINCRDSNNNRTALYWAIGTGHIGTVKLLLAKGSDKSIKDSFGLTPYQFALKFEKYEIAELLK